MDILPQIKGLGERLILLKQREFEISSLLNNQDNHVAKSDVKRLIQSLNCLLGDRNKKELKAVYRSFIKEITFEPTEKAHLNMMLYFDEGINQQLNDIYQEVSIVFFD